MEPVIGTQGGGKFDFRNPDPNDITIERIAHSQSKQCRFTGHTRDFYSIAQHSVYVSLVLPEPLKLWGLLHDGHEFAVGDNSSPFKAYMEEHAPGVIKKLEAEIDEAIKEAFSNYLTPEPFTPEGQRLVKAADYKLLYWERDWLLPDTDYLYPDYLDPSKHPGGCILQADPMARPWTPEEARVAFLRQFYSLIRGPSAKSFVNVILRNDYPQHFNF